MADPRLTVAFEGVAPVTATYKIDNSTITFNSAKAGGADATMIGKAVTLSAASTVALAADGDAVIGKLLTVESDNYCTVQTGGYMSLPGGSGASLTLGKKIVGALGVSSVKGYIREVATGTAAELGKQNGAIHDASDTTAVVVKF
jgi:hypothetical protein